MNHKNTTNDTPNFKVNTPYNYEIPIGEVNNKPSMTVPDMTMSMRTILDRHAKGLPIGGSFQELWDDEPEQSLGIKMETLDLVDIQELKEQNKNVIEDYKNKVKQAELDKQAADKADTAIIPS